MLENNFNELDDDFITIWSYICLQSSQPETKTLNKLKDLQRLAELGQINAFQSLFLFNLKYIDIDKAVEKFDYLTDKNYEANFNEELAIYHARKNYNSDNGSSRASRFDYHDISLEQHRDIVLKKHEIAYQISRNPLILERYYEIKYNPDEHFFSSLITKRGAKKLREKLYNLHILNLTENKYSFAYAKNLLFFGNKAEQKHGKNLLQILANKEYSQTLKDYLQELENKQKAEHEARVARERKHLKDINEGLCPVEEKLKYVNTNDDEYISTDDLFGSDDCGYNGGIA